MKRKIAVITATRAEYGLFYPVLKQIQSDDDLDLLLIVTGTHLQDAYGKTIDEIKSHGFDFICTENTFSENDGARNIVNNFSKSAVIAAEIFEKHRPDVVLVLGDRYEMFAFTTAGFLMHIPIAHIAGGELTYGAIDDSIRHAITKLSNIHFPAVQEYADRIIRMGENPEQVFVVGSTGVENALNTKLSDKKMLENDIGFCFGKKNLILTFHPVTTDLENSLSELNALFGALDIFPEIKIILTAPNADEGSSALMNKIRDYAEKNKDRAVYIKSLGFKNYLSCLQFVDGVIGNSSSGIIEAPSFKIGTINIGSRQEGRIRALSVIDCEPNLESIVQALEKLYSQDFQNLLEKVDSPFFRADTSLSIKNILKSIDLKNMRNKIFYDQRYV